VWWGVCKRVCLHVSLLRVTSIAAQRKPRCRARWGEEGTQQRRLEQEGCHCWCSSESMSVTGERSIRPHAGCTVPVTHCCQVHYHFSSLLVCS
jgi:hypothetical protein